MKAAAVGADLSLIAPALGRSRLHQLMLHFGVGLSKSQRWHVVFQSESRQALLVCQLQVVTARRTLETSKSLLDCVTTAFLWHTGLLNLLDGS